MSPRIALFALLCVAQLGVTASLIGGAERARHEGRSLRFQSGPVDPADLARGRYVRLWFRAVVGPSLDAEPFAKGERVYALYREGDDGWAELVGVTREPQRGDDHIVARVSRVEPGGVRIEFPIDRYYLPEDKARAAEQAYWRARGEAWAEVRLHEGEATIVGLYIGEVPILEAIDLEEDAG